MSLVPPIPKPSAPALLPRHAAYVVAFTLNGPPLGYTDFIDELRECDGWFNYIPGFWIVLTRRPIHEFAASLRQKIRTSDWLVVMPAKGPVDGWLPKPGWDWVNKHLTNEW
jgi:hypothetical protein